MNDNESDNIENANFDKEPSIKEKNTKKWLIILGIVIISLVAIITSIILLTKNSSTQNLKDNKEQKLHSFFIKNADKQYALYNSKGKQLTEFCFKEEGQFYNEVTVVKKDDKYAIINENGKLIVGYDVYNTIKQYTFMFVGIKKDGTKEVLDYKGKVWSDYTDINKSTENIACLVKGDNIEIINSELKHIATLPTQATSTYIAVAEKDNYAYIYLYEDKIGYLIDMNKQDKYLKFSQLYNIEAVDNKQNAIVLAHCYRKYSTSRYENVDEVLVLKDFKTIYKSNEEFQIESILTHNFRTKFMNNYVYIEGLKKLVCLSNGNETDFSKYTSVSFMTPDTYAVTLERTAEFFANSKLVNTVDKTSEIYSLEDLYYGRESKYSNYYYIYKKDGTLLNDKKYKSIDNIDSYTILKETEKYYIVDKNFNKVTEECLSIQTKSVKVGTDQYEKYFVMYSDSKKTLKLLDKNLKTVFDYTSPDDNIGYISLDMHNGQLYVTMNFTASKARVYNANSNKLVSDIDSSWDNKKDYYTVKKGNTKTYYSYIEDKAFYTEQ